MKNNLSHCIKQSIQLLGKLYSSTEDLHAVARSLVDKNFVPRALAMESEVQDVTPQVLHNLYRLESTAQILVPNSQHLKVTIECVTGLFARRSEAMNHLLGDYNKWAAAADQQEIRHVAVKGAALHHLYPEESPRLFGDIDLVVHPEDGWRALQLLQDTGYFEKRIRIESHSFRSSGRGVVGVAEMYSPGSKYVAFDVHIGGFPGCGDILLDQELWDRRSVPKGTVHASIPSTEDSLLILISHITRHGYARLRDVNDLYVLLHTPNTAIDWDYLNHYLNKNGLMRVMAAVMRKMYRVYNDSHAAKQSDIPPRISGLSQRASLYSSMIFDAGQANSKFHGKRKLFWGRFCQAMFLFERQRSQVSIVKALWKTFLSFFWLLKTGRPYHLWKYREIRSFYRDDRLVIVPVPVEREGALWVPSQGDLEYLLKTKSNIEDEIPTVVGGMMIWCPAAVDEIILTVSGVYTQSSYFGTINLAEMELAKNAVKKIVSKIE